MRRPRSRPYRCGYGRSLRPCLAPPSAPRRRVIILNRVLSTRPEHVQLGELTAAAVGVELEQEDVVVLALDRASSGGEVARHADGDCAIPLDEPRAVLGRPRALLVALVEPARDDGVPAAGDVVRLVPRVVPVRCVLAEQLGDRAAIVGLPRGDVVGEPAGDLSLVHDDTLTGRNASGSLTRLARCASWWSVQVDASMRSRGSWRSRPG
jgi:hypothetical protein